MENFINPIDINITGKTENIFRKPRPEIEFTFDYEVNKIYIQKNEDNLPILYDKQT